MGELGLDQLWAEIFQPGSPLAFLTAQGLRVAQPMLSAFTSSAGLSAVETLAQRLESPPTLDETDSPEELTP